MKGIVLAMFMVVSGAPHPAASRETPASRENPMPGESDTGRDIHLEIVVPVSRSELFQLWTTEEGVRKFFAPYAKIEPRVGGRYEMIFAPDLDPEGANQGTKGARILRFENDRMFAFEWIPFVFEKHPSGLGPPVVPRDERNERPIPTWVEIELEDVPGHPGHTRLRLVHRGFRSGGAWDEALPYFWRQWGAILGRLGSVCTETVNR
jgi:uncharacterized protein YndB with AHSA1/START domain